MLLSTKRPAVRRTLMIVLTGVLAFALAACGQKESKDTIAEYEGGTVTKEQFDTFTNVLRVINPEVALYLEMADYKNMVLDQYIGYQLVYKDATKEVKDKAAKDADEQYKQIEAALGKEALDKSLKDNKIEADDVKNFITLSLGVTETMAAKVTDDEAKKYYDENKEGLTKVTLRHILVGFTDAEGKERKKEDALARAKEAKKKLEAANADWNALAKEYSEDPGSKDAGGQYADQAAGGWVEAFKKAALEQEIGVIGEPVETEYGYHVIKVEKRELPTFDQSKEGVKQTLAQNKLNEYMEKEVPKLVKSKEKFTDPSPSPGASSNPSTSPSPSSSPSPSTSPSPSPAS
ncbi:peptidylprolyl isomerase [Paenibacillus pasadenensis]|uniref:peptidylprolyl isomerase n=1 Tax=Paenibacillus pasadenensis TaxID=217090 RepID=UPI00203E7DBA|nr:peptidylprolyl isomerase [Paenibacillus pasadenensis]MCM3750045.1 peptidylprolyl isomerase [Paenibacillus pasadenensis]